MPTRRAATLALILALLVPAAALEPRVFGVVLAADAALLLLVAADGLLAVPPRSLRLVRRHPPSTLQMAPVTVRLDVDNPSARRAALLLHDGWPADVVAPGARTRLSLPGAAGAEVAYQARPTRRGDRTTEGLHVASSGPLGLFRRVAFVPLPGSLQVLPSAGRAGTSGIVARRMLRREMGLHRARQRGVGREFESLRPYVAGDEPRHVDWKISARRGHLVTREYAPERDQTIVLMVDCGRMMAGMVGSTRHEPMSRLDHALASALALARAATDAGDQVALALFSSELHVFLAPGRGPEWLARAAALVYRRQADGTEPDYPKAYAIVRRRIRHRALVVTFTDIADTEQSRTLVACNLALRPRYLPLLVTFEDTELAAVASSIPRRREELYEKAAAMEYMADVRRTLARLEKQGAETLEVPGEEMPARVLQRYLDLKLKGRL